MWRDGYNKCLPCKFCYTKRFTPLATHPLAQSTSSPSQQPQSKHVDSHADADADADDAITGHLTTVCTPPPLPQSPPLAPFSTTNDPPPHHHHHYTQAVQAEDIQAMAEALASWAAHATLQDRGVLATFSVQQQLMHNILQRQPDTSVDGMLTAMFCALFAPVPGGAPAWADAVSSAPALPAAKAVVAAVRASVRSAEVLQAAAKTAPARKQLKEVMAVLSESLAAQVHDTHSAIHGAADVDAQIAALEDAVVQAEARLRSARAASGTAVIASEKLRQLIQRREAAAALLRAAQHKAHTLQSVAAAGSVAPSSDSSRHSERLSAALAGLASALGADDGSASDASAAQAEAARAQADLQAKLQPHEAALAAADEEIRDLFAQRKTLLAQIAAVDEKLKAAATAKASAQAAMDAVASELSGSVGSANAQASASLTRARALSTPATLTAALADMHTACCAAAGANAGDAAATAGAHTDSAVQALGVAAAAWASEDAGLICALQQRLDLSQASLVKLNTEASSYKRMLPAMASALEKVQAKLDSVSAEVASDEVALAQLREQAAATLAQLQAQLPPARTLKGALLSQCHHVHQSLSTAKVPGVSSWNLPDLPAGARAAAAAAAAAPMPATAADAVPASAAAFAVEAAKPAAQHAAAAAPAASKATKPRASSGPVWGKPTQSGAAAPAKSLAEIMKEARG